MGEFKGKHVLVVEDSNIMRGELCALFRSLGFVVLEAENGQVAWTTLEDRRVRKEATVDLIVSDVNMPTMDGLQLLERVKAHADFQKIPFYILTANKEELIRLTAKCLDVTAFFLKPLNLIQLMAQLKKSVPK